MLKTKMKIKMTLLLQFDRNELLIVKEWGEWGREGSGNYFKFSMSKSKLHSKSI